MPEDGSPPAEGGEELVEADYEVVEDPGETPAKTPTHVRLDMFNRFLEVQGKEIEVRAQEVGVKQLEVRAGYRFSKASLEAQERDLKNQREESRSKRRDHLLFSVFALLLLAAILVYMLQTGKDELAKEILKALVFISAGGASGFFAGKASERKKQADEE